MTSQANHSADGQPRKRRPWAPDGDDHLIFDYVRMKGKTQEWVAIQLGISQSTVSRVVQRYERWQAHAQEREIGLTHAEQLRSQRRLTYDRNELMLASCLRIADEMQQLHYATSTTKVEQAAQGETIRTHQEQVDQSGVACRFFRLGFRINMEQLKLAERDAPPELPPLTAAEIEEEEVQAAAATEELRAANEKTIREFNENHRRDTEGLAETERLQKIEAAERLALAEEILRGQDSGDGGQESEVGGQRSEVGEDEAPAVVNSVHKVHKQNGKKSAVSNGAATSCDESPRREEISPPACMDELGGRSSPRPEAGRNTNRGHEPVHSAASVEPDRRGPKKREMQRSEAAALKAQNHG